MLIRNTFYKAYFSCVVLSLSLITIQCFFGVINKQYIYFYRNINYTISAIEQNNNLLKIENLQLLNRINKLIKYDTIFNSLKHKYAIKSYLDVLYFNKNQNGHYLIAKTDKKVDINDIVIDKNTLYVGRVVEIFKNNNIKIQLLTDKQSYIPSMTTNNIYGIVENNNAKCKTMFIPFDKKQNKNVKDGDLITTSGYESLIQQGILIGKIKKYNDFNCIETIIDDYNNIAVLSMDNLT